MFLKKSVAACENEQPVTIATCIHVRVSLGQHQQYSIFEPNLKYLSSRRRMGCTVRYHGVVKDCSVSYMKSSLN